MNGAPGASENSHSTLEVRAMRLAQTMRRLLFGLALVASPLLAQNPIKFWTPSNTVFTDSLQSLYVDLCLEAYNDTSGVHRAGKMYLDVPLQDGGLATTCSGGTGTNLVADLSLKPGTNYFVVEVVDGYWTTWRDSILVSYQLPAGSGGAPYVVAPAEGGLRLMPGEQRTLTFVVTNVSQDTTGFDVTLSCSGGLSSCLKVGGGSQFTTASLLPGTSETVQVRATASTSPGTGTFRFIAVGGLIDTGTTAVSISRDPLVPIKVSRMADTLVRPASATHTAYFQISNPDHFATQSVTPSLDCESSSPCSVAPSFISLAAGRDTMVKVTFSSPSSGHRKIRLTTIMSGGKGAGKDSMWVKAGTALAGVLELTALEAGPRSSTARGECLSIAAGPGAGVECGALRLGYAFPSITSMSSTRTLGLVYLSDHAKPYFTIPLRVRIRNRTDSLNLRTSVSIGGHSLQHTFAWDPACTLPSGCVVNAPVNADSVNLQTGDYAYSATVEALGATGVSAEVSGTIVIVNRKSTPYGPGWWLDGIERLMVSSVDSTRRIWIGGDGSTRRFKHVGSGVYIAEDSVQRSERLVRAGSGAGTTWTRQLRGGATVTFDNLMRHVRTTNREGHQTVFDYVGASVDKLAAVRFPIQGTDTLRIFLSYNAGGIMDSVWAPWNTSGPMITRVRRDGSGRVTLIIESSGDSIRYVYSGSSTLPAERLDRLGNSVKWEYAVAGRVSRIAAALAVNDTVATRLCAAESRALTPCTIDGSGQRAVPASRYRSVFDGPRPDSDARDISQFYVGRYGGVDSIVDPYGGKTRLFREDTSFRALVTRVVDVAGVTSEMLYDGHGLPIRRIVKDQWSIGSHDTMLITWDTTWHAVTEQRSADGVIFRQGLDGYGNRIWQQRGTGDSTRVHVAYDAYNRPLKTFTVNGDTTVLATYSYNTWSGNLLATVSSTGQRSRVWLNYAGVADSIETTLLNSGACHATTNPCVRQHFRRDAAGRVLRDSTISPALNWSVNPEASAPLTGSAPSLLGLVTTSYDKEGRALSISRSTPGLEYANASATSTFVYDALGRTVKSSIRGIFDSTSYDKAGNPIRLRTRNGHVITQTFDAMGRLTSRTTPEVRYAKSTCTTCSPGQPLPSNIRVPYYATRVGPDAHSQDVVIPSETSVYAYDAAGRMIQADNPLVRVRRGYYPNGALKADTSEMRKYHYTASDNGFGATHRAVLQYTYDRDGRTVSREDSWGGGQKYAYDVLGQLAFTRDSAAAVQVGGQVAFAYDRHGQMIQQSVVGSSFVDTWVYDVHGRPIERGGNMDETMQYDARGKRTRIDGRLQYPNGLEIVMTAAYDGFGNLVATGTTGDAIYPTDEFLPDAFGNSIRRFGNRGQALSGIESANSFNFWGPQLMSSTGLPYPTPADSNRTGINGGPPVQAYDELSLHYDAAGNTSFQSSIRQVWVSQHALGGTWETPTTGHSFTWTFYDADARPRFVQRHVKGSSPAVQTTYHEFWYDALGRRVLVRDRSDSTSCGPSNETQPIPCQQSITRYTWDGNQLLREKRGVGGWYIAETSLEGTAGASPWYGTRRYTHAGSIDSPVILWMNDASPRAIVRNWRGSAAGGLVLATGTADTYVYPAARTDVQMAPDQDLSPLTPNAWMGSLIDEQRDATGLLYRRNRYYDPATGRFTQPDPIGLAGGLNLYGYAGGDPVNFSDPFGLFRLEGAAAQQFVRDLQAGARSLDAHTIDGAPTVDPECNVALAIAVMSTIGDLSIGLGAVKVAALGVRAVAHGSAARMTSQAARSGLTDAGADHMARVTTSELAASNASVWLAGHQSALTVGAAAESAAGGMNHVVSGLAASGWDFVPGVGTYRAWQNVGGVCAGK